MMRDLALHIEKPSYIAPTIGFPNHDIADWIEWMDGALKGLAVLWEDEALESKRRALRKVTKANASMPSLQLYSELLSEAALARDSRFALQLWRELMESPTAELENSVNRGQMASKKWLLEQMNRTLGRDLGSIFIMGGWYGVLGALLLEDARFKVDRVVSFDIRDEATRIAESLNRDWVKAHRKFSASTADIMTMDYDGTDKPDLVINTVCEHLPEFDRWMERIPSGTRLVLQSNNYYEEETHVNCVDTLEDFAAQAKLSKVLFQGSTPTKNYDRFMLIGLK